MNRKSLIIICVGILVLVVTFIGFNYLLNSVAPTEAEFIAASDRAATLILLARAKQANFIRNTFFVVAAGEIMYTLFLAWSKRHD